MRRRPAAGALVAAACLALVGCTPSGGTQPTPTPVPSVTTPSETAQEREERLAYEAAETSYREFSTEYRKVTAAGGARSATTTMKATAAGPYLAEAVKVIKAFEETGGHTTGQARIGYLRPAGYAPDSLLLDVCEDETSVKTFDARGKQVAVNGILALRLDVRVSSGSWKVWDYTGKEVKACE